LNLTAVADDVFLKTFFAKAISVDELQGKMKKLPKGRHETCAEILGNIHSDYRALETGEPMRDATGLSSNSLLSRRFPKEYSGKKVPIIPHLMNILPHNVNNLLPRTYYSQFGEWYSHIVILEPLRSDSSKQWLLKFKLLTLHQNMSRRNTREGRGDNANRSNDSCSN